jgi:Immunoglobulin-like domain of bacterial spore germination
MNDDFDLDPRLAELLSDAVSDVQPADRLAAIRAETKGSAMNTHRPWLLATTGAALAAAAVVTAVALTSGTGAQQAKDPTPGASVSESPSPTPGTAAVPVYYVGDTPSGPRLYREFQSVVVGEADKLTTAANLAASGEPLDPDYRTLWGSGITDKVTFEQGQIQLYLLDDGANTLLPGMTPDDAELAIQQIVYTVQAAAQDRAPVLFMLGDAPATALLGIPLDGPVHHAPQLDVLAHVNVTTPEQGADITGDALEVSGVASSFEANVPWEIVASDGTVALSGFSSAAGYMDRLYPWSNSIDISALPPGDYTFIARTDDPSDGEGPGASEDSKDFTLR